MILWSLLIGVLLVAVLHRLDLAVEPAARSESDPLPADASAGDVAPPGLPDPVHLPEPSASGLAAGARPHRVPPVPVGGQLTVDLHRGSFPAIRE